MRRTASNYTKWYHGPYNPRQQSYNDHQAGFIPNRQTIIRKVVHTKHTRAGFATFQLLLAFFMRNFTKILLMTENWKFLSKKLKKWKTREPKMRLLRVQTVAEPLFYWLSDDLTWSPPDGHDMIIALGCIAHDIILHSGMQICASQY